jgi:predicted O-methyltransferase YrrM
MPDEHWTSVDHYLEDALVGPDAPLAAALDANAAAGLPAIDVSAPQGKLLFLLARLRAARTILELGTLGGYSTIWLARALPPDGRLVTLELEPSYAEVARANVERAGLAPLVEFRVGPALDGLDALAGEGGGPFDLIFIDADKRTTPDYLRRALGLSRPGTLIVLDNVVRNGSLVDPDATDASTEGMREAVALLGSDPRVDATVIQTVGTKGWDGFALALVVDAAA